MLDRSRNGRLIRTAKHWASRGSLILTISCALLAAGNTPVLAYSCSSNSFYYAGNESVNGYYGIAGYLTDPSQSNLQGNAGNYYDQSHITLYLSMINLSIPKGYVCGGNHDKCWIDVGVGMGTAGSTTWGDCQNGPAYNLSSNYQVFFEDVGAGGVYNCRDFFYPNGAWTINQDSAIPFEVTYDGGVGYTNEPQFQAYALGMPLNTGELFSTIDHAYALAEAYTGQTSGCPDLAEDPPYQNFGTDANGNYDYGQYDLSLQPQSQGGWEDWPPTPYEISTNPFWRSDVHDPDSFQTNGPAGGPL